MQTVGKFVVSSFQCSCRVRVEPLDDGISQFSVSNSPGQQRNRTRNWPVTPICLPPKTPRAGGGSCDTRARIVIIIIYFPHSFLSLFRFSVSACVSACVRIRFHARSSNDLWICRIINGRVVSRRKRRNVRQRRRTAQSVNSRAVLCSKRSAGYDNTRDRDVDVHRRCPSPLSSSPVPSIKPHAPAATPTIARTTRSDRARSVDDQSVDRVRTAT